MERRRSDVVPVSEDVEGAPGDWHMYYPRMKCNRKDGYEYMHSIMIK